MTLLAQFGQEWFGTLALVPSRGRRGPVHQHLSHQHEVPAEREGEGLPRTHSEATARMLLAADGLGGLGGGGQGGQVVIDGLQAGAHGVNRQVRGAGILP